MILNLKIILSLKTCPIDILINSDRIRIQSTTSANENKDELIFNPQDSRFS